MKTKKYRKSKKRAATVITQFYDDGTGNYDPIWTVTPQDTAHGSLDFESAADIKEFAEELNQWVAKNIKDK